MKLGSAWLEFNGVTVPWDIHVGVAYDILSRGKLPFLLTISTSAETNDALLAKPDPEYLEGFFVNQRKQADLLRFGVLLCSHTTQGDRKDMWNAFAANSEDAFQDLMSKYEEKAKLKPIRFAIRMYFKGNVSTYTQPVLLYESDLTLGELLSKAEEQLTEAGFTSKGKLIVSAGVELHKDTPATFLAQHMVHPDGFIHLILEEE